MCVSVYYTYTCGDIFLRTTMVEETLRLQVLTELEGILKVQGLSSVQIRVRAGTEIRQILS